MLDFELSDGGVSRCLETALFCDLHMEPIIIIIIIRDSCAAANQESAEMSRQASVPTAAAPCSLCNTIA